jgi:predicted phosphohydrolase
MNIFGDNWEGHWGKIKKNWESCIKQEDLVLIPGDISWAMNIEQAVCDLDEIAALPGTKLMIKGNHDYWWSSPTKVRKTLKPGMHILQNDHFAYRGKAVCGTRGWILPGVQGFDEHDNKLLHREIQRLEFSIKSALNKGLEISVAMLHFPPYNEKAEPNELVKLLKQYNIKKVVYGHLHSYSTKNAVEGVIDGIEYILTSCDHLNFAPIKILE